MRNGLVLVGGMLVIAACAHSNRDVESVPGYTAETTGATVGPADPRLMREATVNEVANSLTSQICAREIRCHGESATDQCQQTYSRLSTHELAGWQCSPAAARARAEECAAALNAEPCEMDFSTRPSLCPASQACPDSSAGLASPGAEIAQARSLSSGQSLPRFDHRAAASSLQSIDLTECARADGPIGPGHVTVTFAPDGGVLDSQFDARPDGSFVDLWGSSKGQCIVERLRKARVPTFDGPPVSIGISVPLS